MNETNKLIEQAYRQGRRDKYQEITENYMLLTEEQVKEIRIDAIEKFADYILNSYDFDILNADALEFMINDAKCNLLKEVDK